MKKFLVSYLVLFLFVTSGSVFQGCDDCGSFSEPIQRIFVIEKTKLCIFPIRRIVKEYLFDGSFDKYDITELATTEDTIRSKHDSLLLGVVINYTDVSLAINEKPSNSAVGFSSLNACSPPSSPPPIYKDQITAIEILSDKKASSENDVYEDVSGLFSIVPSSLDVMRSMEVKDFIDDSYGFENRVIYLKVKAAPLDIELRTLIVNLTTKEGKRFSSKIENLLLK